MQAMPDHTFGQPSEFVVEQFVAVVLLLNSYRVAEIH
jgi:hypothetical protein